MVRTPGFVLPSSFSSMEELQKDLKRRAEASGFTPFDPDTFLNEVVHEDSKESNAMTTEVDNYLEHYGVKGMRWGKRSSSSSSSDSNPGKSRKELRALDRQNRKAAKQKARDDYDNEILKARNSVDKDAQRYNEAKKQYKSDKTTMGKVAAREILREHEQKYVDSWNTATLQTTKEAQVNMIAGVGLLALSAIVPMAAAASRNSW